jgi:hypothetical protein
MKSANVVKSVLVDVEMTANVMISVLVDAMIKNKGLMI